MIGRCEPPGQTSGQVDRAPISLPKRPTNKLFGIVGVASILGGKPHYIHFGWFSISAANLVVIVLMIVVFALAIALPIPREHSKK
jgi:hypothetical protein